jgi:HAD superfamily hydrolase (TIGR01490 family)
MAMKKIAIFDMDRTITRTGTFTPFLIFTAWWWQPWRLILLPLFLIAIIGYPLRLIDRKSIKALGFRLMLGNQIQASTLKAMSRSFAEFIVRRGVYADAKVLIAKNKAEGRALVMATASPDFYAEEIGALLGFNAVIATRQSRSSTGDYHAEIDGANCYGQAKLARISEWLKGPRNEAHVCFYSDHHSDAATFEWADTAVAVNPDTKLHAIAVSRSWATLSLR